MKKFFLTLIFILLIAAVVSLGFFYFAQYRMTDTTQTQPETPVTQMEDFLVAGDFAGAIQFGNQTLDSGSLGETETLAVAEMLASAVLWETHDMEPQAATAMLAPLYERIYNYGNNSQYTNLFRASMYAQMNRIFEQSGLDYDAYVAGLKRFNNGAVYAEFQSAPEFDTNEAIAYTSLYRLNAEAEKLYPDKFNKAWQVWIVGISMLQAPKEDDLHDEFVAYIKSSLTELPAAEFETISSEAQQIWIEQALLVMQLRLAEAFPQDFTLNAQALDTQFLLLLDRAIGLTPRDVRAYSIEYVVRIAYLAFLHQTDADVNNIQLILEPLLDADFTRNAPSVAQWMEEGEYRAGQEDTDYLLNALYEISKTNEELKVKLQTFGWQYEPTT